MHLITESKECEHFFSRGFKRVLELPSENWIQLAQNWCCHGNNNLSNMTGALEPDENDCFVGEYYIMVNSSSVVSDNLQILPVSVLYSMYTILYTCFNCHMHNNFII